MSITKEDILNHLKNDLSEPNLQIFKNSVEVNEEKEAVSLIVNDAYMKQWVENKCLTIIKSYIDKVIQIEISEMVESNDNSQLELFQSEASVQPSKFNSLFTLDRFIVGNNNRFAFAAAEAVSKRPANAYNPLFIYGSVGIGKTHLLHAIANEISKKNPKCMFSNL